MKRKKLLLVMVAMLATIGIVTAAAAVTMTWARTITWNIPINKGFDVYTCTKPDGSWIQGDKMRTAGYISVTDTSYTEDYWIQNTGNVPVNLGVNPSGGGLGGPGMGITLTLQYDSNSTHYSTGIIWASPGGMGSANFNLQVGEYLIIELSITNIQVGQSGLFSLSFVGN